MNHIIVKCSREKQQLTLDKRERQQLGSKLKTGGYRSEEGEPGCQVSPLSPLEKLWAFQCNVNKRGSQPDDPDDEPTFTSPVALPTYQCTTEIKLNPFSFNFPHNLSGPSQVESLNLRITHELDSLRGIGKLCTEINWS